MRNIVRTVIAIIGVGLLAACASPAALDSEVDAGNVTGISEPLIPDSGQEDEGTAPGASSGGEDEMQESASDGVPRGQRPGDDDEADDDGQRDQRGDDDDEADDDGPRDQRGGNDDEADSDEADDDGQRACPAGWQTRIAQADIGTDPRLCGLPPGVCANIARGKPVPPGIRRNAQACGIDVDALVSQLTG